VSITPLPAGTDPQRHLARRGLRGRHWSAGPGAHFPWHRHERTKHLFVLRGAISFNGASHRAPAGLVIPRGLEHEATAGPEGVECVEAFEGEG
jgi:quercetin dioxygenase-like cupin family protein